MTERCLEFRLILNQSLSQKHCRSIRSVVKYFTHCASFELDRIDVMSKPFVVVIFTGDCNRPLNATNIDSINRHPITSKSSISMKSSTSREARFVCSDVEDAEWSLDPHWSPFIGSRQLTIFALLASGPHYGSSYGSAALQPRTRNGLQYTRCRPGTRPQYRDNLDRHHRRRWAVSGCEDRLYTLSLGPPAKTCVICRRSRSASRRSAARK